MTAAKLGAAVLLCVCSISAMAAWQPTDYYQSPVSNGSYAAVWSSRYTSLITEVNDVVVDSTGNVYATGMIDDGVSADIFTTKHDVNGNLVWQALLDCPGLSASNCYDRGVALALDGNGFLYVAGDSHNGSDTDIVVHKYNVDTGQTAAGWSGSGRYSGAASDDKLVDIVVGGTDKVYVTGTTCVICNSNDPVSGTDTDIITVRFLTSGNVNWSTRYDSTVFDSNNNPVGYRIDDIPVGLGIDPDGNVLVGGTSKGPTDDFVALKYNSVNGNDATAWAGAHIYDSAANDKATVMAVDANGDLYVAGWSRQTGVASCSDVSGDILVTKFSGVDGSLLWDVGCLDGGLGRDLPVAMQVDSNSNLYIAAKTGIIPSDYYTLKLDASGGVVWDHKQDIGDDDTPGDIAVDAAGNTYVTGGGGTILSHDLTTIRLDNTGQLTDVLTQNLNGNELAAALDLGTDGDGDAVVYVGAVSDRANLGESDYVISKYALMRPDLVVNAFTGPALAPYDSVIDLDFAVENVLDELAGKMSDANAFSVGFYLSTVANPAPGDLLSPFMTYNFTGLASGAASGTISQSWLVPNTLPLGFYYLVARVDDGDAVIEQDEVNNIFVGAQIEVIDPPDLIVSSVSGPASMAAGNNIDINFTVANIRSVAAGASDVSLVLSQDATVDPSDTVLTAVTSTTVPVVAGGGSYNGTVTATIPAALTPGDYYIGVIADSGSVIVESLETNNSNTSSPSTITVNPIPNLISTSVSGPLGGVVNTSLTVDTTVSAVALNSGDVVDAFSVAVYLSTDATIDPAVDYLLGTRTITPDLLTGIALAAGASDSGTVTGTAPAVEGIYYLGVIADSANTVLENNEQDNSTVSTQTISIGLPAGTTGAKPDLVITNVSLVSATAQRGALVSVSTRVDNIVPEPVPATNPFVVGIYLSPDANITTADLRIGERIVSGLGGNTSDEVVTDMILPSETVEPIQWTNLLATTVEANNTLTSQGAFWNASASSVQQITADGAIEMTVAQTGTNRFFGLNDNDTGGGFVELEYAFALGSNGQVAIYESGTRITFAGNYTTGSVMRIERQGSTVRFFRNGTLLYTSPTPSSGALVADTAFNEVGGSISNATITIVDLPTGSYYLGAIADDKDAAGNVSAGVNRVDEMNEANNSGLQTDGSGAASSVAVNILNVGATAGSNSSGGGSLGWVEMVLFGVSLLWWRRRLLLIPSVAVRRPSQ